jgi:hypothetical protein
MQLAVIAVRGCLRSAKTGRGTIASMLDMRQGQCPLCQHDEIIEATLSEFSGELDERERPLAIAHGTQHRFIVGERTDPEKAYGVLSQCICRRCGFVQWFAAKPGEIPVDTTPGLRMIRSAAGRGPYRT